MNMTSNSGISLEAYEPLVSQISKLLKWFPPPFIYIQDSSNLRITASVLRSTIEDIKHSSDLHLAHAFVNGITCFNPRIFYDTVLNALADWSPNWEEGCSNWAGPSQAPSQRFNDSFDGFCHGLRAVDSMMKSEVNGSMELHAKGKIRAPASQSMSQECRMLLVIEHAERLKESLPNIVVPLTRLAEMSQVNITTILLSELRWEHIRPPYGASPDPFYIDVPPLTKQATLNRLISAYPTLPESSQFSHPIDKHTYHPALRPLYTHFITALYNICSPFTTDYDELAYIAAAMWPGFVQPVIDEHKLRTEELHAQRSNQQPGAQMPNEEEDDSVPDSVGEEPGGSKDDPELELKPPTEDARIRLIRLFTPSFTAALETLYPRLSSALSWAHANAPPPDLLSISPRQLTSITAQIPTENEGRGIDGLPSMAKFILVSAFLASTNPSKSDMRMFGRGPDERAKRRKRKSGSPRKASAKSSAVKIPQRLLGPMAFPLDRMLAILGVLIEENDVETRPPAAEFTVPGEYTEMEISRVAVYAQVMELSSMHLLHRTSPPDRLELSPTFKCGISYDVALSLARDLGVALNDLVWEPV